MLLTSSCWKGMFLLALFIANFDEFVVARTEIQLCWADNEEEWSYRGSINGAYNWKRIYRECGGNEQSPIDIVTKNVIEDSTLGQLKLENFDMALSDANIKNNGHSVQVTPKDGVNRTIFVDGKIYSLIHFNFHWGCDNTDGSGHTVDGKTYPLEVHFVHQSPEGKLAVVGVFFEENETAEINWLEMFAYRLHRVKFKDAETQLDSSRDLTGLLPTNPLSFYRYDGSLTTPPCSEGVLWFVGKDPIVVGRGQMKNFRRLYSVTFEDSFNYRNRDCKYINRDCKMCGNYRPVQPLNGRNVTSST